MKFKSTKTRDGQIWGMVNLATKGWGGGKRDIKIFWKIGNEDLAQRIILSKSAIIDNKSARKSADLI